MLSSLGRDFLLLGPELDTQIRLGSWKEVEEATAGSEAGRARNRGCKDPPPPPPGGGSRGGQRSLRLASSGQGAEPIRPVITRTASKASRLSQSALEPWPARSLPGAGKQGLGNSHLLRLTLFHKIHWILHASVTPTSTPCPHDPVPATGKGFCVFFLFSSRLSVCVCPGAMNLRHRPLPYSSRCSGGAQLSGCS